MRSRVETIGWGAYSAAPLEVREVMDSEVEFDAAWLLERVGMDVERLMREQKLTRAGIAARLEADGCAVDSEWVGRLVSCQLLPDETDLRVLTDVFCTLRRRSASGLERRRS